MGYQRVLTATLVFVLVLGLSVSVAAQVGSPANAQPLTGGTTVSGALPGSKAGSFAYYSIHYPGDKAQAKIQVTVVPGDAIVVSGVGFNVYNPQGFSLGKPLLEQTKNQLTLNYGAQEPTDLLIQIFNYDETRTVNYTLTTSGFPTQRAAAPQALPVTGGQEGAVQMQPLSGSVSGTLVGTSGGTFAKYTLSAEVDKDTKLALIFVPDDPSFQGQLGFRVFGPDGRIAEGSALNDQRESRVTLSTEKAGMYIIEVFNYAQGIPMHYTLSVR